MKPDDLDPATKARIEAEEKYRAQVRGKLRGDAGAAIPQRPAKQKLPAAQATSSESSAEAKKGPGCGTWILYGLGLLLLIGLIQQCSGSSGTSTNARTTEQLRQEANARVEQLNAATPEPASPSEAAASTGENHFISGDSYIGCADRDTFNRLVDFAVQKDQTAFAALLLSSDCITFKKGEEVFLDEVPFLSGSIKLRRKGDVQSYWTNVEALQ